ncbi:MAG: response regulator, partial [Oscillospiraceae bacterium]|nr:response regulator [Oscillospiraceae bacterium]
RIICKDGTIRKVEDYGHFKRTEFGDVFYVFISDATEKINQRLTERIQRLEVIEALSINYDSILYFDLENDTVLPYRLSSRTKAQFDKNWGVRGYNEIIKDYIAQWVHPDDRDSVAASLDLNYLQRMLADEPTYYFNYRCIESGETIHLQLRIVNVGKKNANRFVLGIRRTDEEMQREILQNQILENALKAARLAESAKNVFLANMSHDMRTPLNALFGFATLARENLTDAESLLYYLNRIEDAGKEIFELTKKVLEASESNTQEVTLHEVPCDLKKLLDEILEWTKPKAANKNLQVGLNVDGLEHSLVFADENKIKNVLEHLIGNAVKYNKRDGSIEIKAAEKPHSGKMLRSYSFSVTDTGIGIGEDVLDRIFAPFEREKDTTESRVSGVGLGLTLAKRSAEIMGGNISVESVKGEGSTFTLTLNLKPVDAEENADGERRAEDLNGVKILLVEDNEINMEIATDLLQGAGCTVDTAENGKIAVEKIKNSPSGAYDVVLMDIQMPVMDGRAATDEIRALGGKRSEIPVIALSANAFERDRRLSLEHGMNAHLTKPIDLENIQKTIGEVLRKK